MVDVVGLVDLLRSDLRSGASKGEMLRAVRQFVKNVDRLGPAGMIERDPGSTGDPRWDALVAGVVEHVAFAHGASVPEWARAVPLEQWWFVTDSPRLHATAFVNTPPALARRNVYLTRASLENV